MARFRINGKCGHMLPPCLYQRGQSGALASFFNIRFYCIAALGRRPTEYLEQKTRYFTVLLATIFHPDRKPRRRWWSMCKKPRS